MTHECILTLNAPITTAAENYFYVPNPRGVGGGGGGHIVFSVDPLGVGISFCVGVAFCLHYLLNEWMDFGQTYTNLSLGEEKC